MVRGVGDGGRPDNRLIAGPRTRRIASQRCWTVGYNNPYWPLFLVFGAVAFWSATLTRRRGTTEFWATGMSVPVLALAGTALVATGMGFYTVVNTLLFDLLDKYFLGATLAAVPWVVRRGRALQEDGQTPFHPAWLGAVPASGWLLYVESLRSIGEFGPLYLAAAQLLALAVAWWTTRHAAPTTGPSIAIHAAEPNTAAVANSDPGRDASAAPVFVVPPAPPVAQPPTATAAPRERPESEATSTPAPSQPSEASGVGRLFISYRREDSAYVTDRVGERLSEHFGRDAVFKDVDSIPLGQDFRKHLREAVGRCDVLIAVIGREWAAVQANGRRRLDDPRDHLRIEIESALERDIPVIPVLIEGAAVPSDDDLPEALRPLAYRNALAVRPAPDFNTDLDRLIRGIEAQIPGMRQRT